MDFYEKYYGQLVGFHIHKVSFDNGDWAGDGYPTDIFPVLHIRNTEGDELRLVLSSDEEGNSGGFAFIEEDV